MDKINSVYEACEYCGPLVCQFCGSTIIIGTDDRLHVTGGNDPKCPCHVDEGEKAPNSFTQ